MWTHLEEECPRTRVQLHRGPIKIFTNWSTSLEVGLALMEDKLKEQVAGLEIGTIFVLCGNSALHTHITNIAVFAHQDQRMEVAAGKFSEQAADVHELPADQGVHGATGEDQAGQARDVPEQCSVNQSLFYLLPVLLFICCSFHFSFVQFVCLVFNYSVYIFLFCYWNCIPSILIRT